MICETKDRTKNVQGKLKPNENEMKDEFGTKIANFMPIRSNLGQDKMENAMEIPRLILEKIKTV